MPAHEKSGKTILFEKNYGVNIDNFKSTRDVDRFIEEVTGRKIGPEGPGYCNIDPDKAVDEALRGYFPEIYKDLISHLK